MNKLKQQLDQLLFYKSQTNHFEELKKIKQLMVKLIKKIYNLPN